MDNPTNSSTGTESCKRDSISAIVLDWIFCNVILTLMPLLLVVIIRLVAKLDVEVLDIAPDYLLVGFAIAIPSYSCAAEYDCPPKKRKLLTAVPFVFSLLCLCVYFALFGDLSLASSFLNNDTTVLVKFIVVMTIYLIINIIQCTILIIKTEQMKQEVKPEKQNVKQQSKLRR